MTEYSLEHAFDISNSFLCVTPSPHNLKHCADGYFYDKDYTFRLLLTIFLIGLSILNIEPAILSAVDFSNCQSVLAFLVDFSRSPSPSLRINRHEFQGSISFDKPKKSYGISGYKRHTAWQATSVYERRRYQKRSLTNQLQAFSHPIVGNLHGG